MITFIVKVDSDEFRDNIIRSIKMSRYHFLKKCRFVINDIFIGIDHNNEIVNYNELDYYSEKINLDIDGILILGIIAVVNSYFNESSCFVRT